MPRTAPVSTASGTTSPGPAQPPRLRADAERNRQLILDAASGAFAERGHEVPMEEIAHRAGVGVGTLYRRFPDRTTLLIAVITHGLHRSCERLRAVQSEAPDAWTALASGLAALVDIPLSMRHDRPLPRETIVALRMDPAFQAAQVDFMAILSGIVAAAQQEGSLRRDIGPGDIASLITLLKRAPNLPADTAALASERTLGIMLDGLRAPATSPAGTASTADTGGTAEASSAPSVLSGRPLTSEDVLPHVQREATA